MSRCCWLVLYFGLYQFVGGLRCRHRGRSARGNALRGDFNPWIIAWFEGDVPWDGLRELFVGEYGIITLGLRYAVAIILPIVGTFFIFFSILEDSGYFPRLALLVDRLFKNIGLTGRAVIPMVLGFGCDTMATMVTRTLETVRERIIATLLLALAIPCSAQLGVILACSPRSRVRWRCGASASPASLSWSACWPPGWCRASARCSTWSCPPCGCPSSRNVLTKTYTRMQWYFMEILPLFILASVLLWLGKITGFFES